MKSFENKTSLIFDLFFCIVLCPLLMTLGPMRYWWGQYPVFAALVAVYLYLCYFAIKRIRLPRLILSRSYLRLAGVVAGFVAATYLITLYPLPDVDFVIPSMSEYQTRVRNYNMAVSTWFMVTIVLSYSLTVVFVDELYHKMLLQSIAENQRQKAELAAFKAQISPHFLFNTLNSLYSLVIGTSEKAEDAFVKFTELLKYTYVTVDNESVPLSEEIAYIRNYIDLQMIRLDEHTTVEWDCRVDDPDTMIPHMIFLTFVENAFKYGTSTSVAAKVAISLELKEKALTFTTSNRILRHRREFNTDMPVGLVNCRNRLAGLFPGKHSLTSEETDGTYRVELKIDLN